MEGGRGSVVISPDSSAESILLFRIDISMATILHEIRGSDIESGRKNFEKHDLVFEIFENVLCGLIQHEER